MNSPAVSVIIATHNRPTLLRRALDSVIGQDYSGDIDVIVVFDRSEVDTSIEVDRPGRRVRAMANTRSPGLAGARNCGVANSSGQFLAFCDDDDEWLPNKISVQVAKAAEGFDTVVSGVYIVYGDRVSARVPRTEDVTLAELVRRRVMEAHPSTVLVSREAFLDRIGEVDEAIPGSFAEDYDWILRASKAGTIGVVPLPLVRVHWGQSLFSQRWRTIIDALDYLVAKHPEFEANDEGLARITGQRAFALAALGERSEARREAMRTMRLNPRERRAYVAFAVSTRVVSAQRVLDLAHRTGRGI